VLSSDIAILDNQKHGTLIRWWSCLNVWKWPKEIPNEESPVYIKNGRRSQIMNYISTKVTMRAILRVHNKDMTKREFRDFWNKGNSKKALRRYIKRTRIKLKFQRERQN